MPNHTLDPMLLSSDISDEQRKFILFHEIGHLAYECNDIYSLIGGTGGKPGPEAYTRFSSAADLAQQLILLSKRLFGTVEAMSDFLGTFSLRQTTEKEESNERKHYLTVAGMALMQESPVLSSTCDWIRQWFKVDEFSSQKNRIPNLRFQVHRVKADFDSIQPGLYVQPRFYCNNEFRNMGFHRFFFGDVVEQQFAEIYSDVRRNPDAASFWFNKISEADKGVEFEMTIQAEMASQLRRLPVDGLWGFRKLILGKAQPSCEECSTRLATALTNAVHHELNEQSLSEAVEALSHNSTYQDGVMLEDICDFFKSDLVTYSNEESGYDGGPTTIDQISKTLTSLELKPECLAFLAMSTVADFSRGRMRDLQSTPVAEQFRAVMASIHRPGRLTMQPDDLRYSLFAGIIRNLPENLVAQMASVNDLTRTTCYGLTGNPSYLLGLKDNKLQDRVFGSDLGL